MPEREEFPHSLGLDPGSGYHYQAVGPELLCTPATGLVSVPGMYPELMSGEVRGVVP